MTVNTSTVTMSSYNRRVEHRPEAVLRACRGSLRYISRAALTPGAQRWNPLRGPALGFPTMGWDPPALHLHCHWLSEMTSLALGKTERLEINGRDKLCGPRPPLHLTA